MTRLEEIKKRVDAASPGPWTMYYTFGSKDLPSEIRHSDGTVTILEWTEKSTSNCADVEFISEARSDVPWLLEQLEVAIEALEFYADYWNYTYGVNRRVEIRAKEALEKIREESK